MRENIQFASLRCLLKKLFQVLINPSRHKLEPDPAHPRYILTKPGIGYLIATQPKSQARGTQEPELQVVAH